MDRMINIVEEATAYQGREGALLERLSFLAEDGNAGQAWRLWQLWSAQFGRTCQHNNPLRGWWQEMGELILSAARAQGHLPNTLPAAMGPLGANRNPQYTDEAIFGRRVLQDDWAVRMLATRSIDDPMRAQQEQDIRAALVRCRAVGWRPTQVQGDAHGPTLILHHPRLGRYDNAHVGVNRGRSGYPHQLVHRGNKCDDVPWDLLNFTYRQVVGVVTVYGLDGANPTQLRVGQQQDEGHIEAARYICGHKRPVLDGAIRATVGPKPEGEGWWPLDTFGNLYDYLRRYKFELVDEFGEPCEVEKATVSPDAEVAA